MAAVSTKQKVLREIVEAKACLDEALEDLQDLQVRDIGATHMITHVLTSYLKLAKGTTELLENELADHPVRDVHEWLTSLTRTTTLMLQAATNLQNGDEEFQPELHVEDVNISTMARRFCAFFRRKCAPRGITIEFDAKVSTSCTRTDRVVFASALGNVFMYAMPKAFPRSKVIVEVEELLDSISVFVCFNGPGLGPAQIAALAGNTSTPDAAVNGNINRAELPNELQFAKQTMQRLGGRIWGRDGTPDSCTILVALPKPGIPATGER